MNEHAYQPPAIEAYYDFVVEHYEDELTQEEISREAKFMYETDRVRLLHAEDPEAELEAIAARLALPE